MTGTTGNPGPTPRRSASAEAAALRHGFLDEAGAPAPPPGLAGGGDPPSPRRSAHAEAAAFRWRERHPGVPD